MKGVNVIISSVTQAAVPPATKRAISMFPSQAVVCPTASKLLLETPTFNANSLTLSY
jgi:hypothetical protein